MTFERWRGTVDKMGDGMKHVVGKASLAAAGLTLVLALLWAGPARAGTTIQLGETSPTAATCTDGNPGLGFGSSFVQQAVAGPPSYTVPSDGRITSWSHHANDSAVPGTGALQVWRPTGGTDYTLIGKSGLRVFLVDQFSTFTTDISVKAGDVLGFRVHTNAPACLIKNTVDALAAIPGAEPGLDTTLSFPDGTGSPEGRLNISATLDPDDPVTPAGPSLDTSATKGKQPVDKLKLKVSSDQTGTLDIGGKGKVPKRVAPSNAAKAKSFKLKTKTGIELSADVTKTIGLKFKKNNRKTVKQISKLLKGSKKARKRSKATVNLTVTGAAGAVSNSTVKIKLKP